VLLPLTDNPNGVASGYLSPDGRFVYYLKDEAGNEIGHLVRVPFEGGEPEDVTPDLEPYAFAGMHVSRDGSKLAFVTAGAGGFQLYVSALGRDGTVGEPRPIYHSTVLMGGVVLTASADVAVVSVTAGQGTTDSKLVALDPVSGDVIAELVDEDGSIDVGAAAPVSGETRYLASSNESGVVRPIIWDPRTGERVDFGFPDVAGDLIPVAWTPNLESVLLYGVHEAETRVEQLNIESGSLSPFPHPAGTLGNLYFDANGDVIVGLHSSAEKHRVYKMSPEGDTDPPVLLAGQDAPQSNRWRSVSFSSTNGAEIQGWLGVPDGEGPFPAFLDTHGGPTGVQTDGYFPRAQTFIDHGFAFLTINYHGSTTFGREFQKSIDGHLGALEVQDMVAARGWLVDEGVADADSIFLTGWSYGGYLTLQALGAAPGLWAGGVAGIAIADWTGMYEDSNEFLRAFQVALFGGTPEEMPEAHAKSSPITYAEDVSAPLLVIQGSNDTRCPAGQMREYEDEMLELGKEIEVVWFEAGHGSYAVEQQIEFTERTLRFAYEVLGRG